jgi:RNA polymerase sigma factor (TIGR02999 family)
VGDETANPVAGFDTGSRTVLDRMMPAVYAELRKLAKSYMQHERSDHTLQPTALVHEAFLRMASQRRVDWCNRAQLLAIAARMMRRILLDHAAAHAAGKRGGDVVRVTLSDDLEYGLPGSIDLLGLDAALNQLSEIDPQQSSIVELRFFGGLTNGEIAEALGLSPATVRRRWASARLWLARHCKEEG